MPQAWFINRRSLCRGQAFELDRALGSGIGLVCKTRLNSARLPPESSSGPDDKIKALRQEHPRTPRQHWKQCFPEIKESALNLVVQSERQDCTITRDDRPNGSRKTEEMER
jgi:hypothetical protein